MISANTVSFTSGEEPWSRKQIFSKISKPWRETSSLLCMYMCVSHSVMSNSLQPHNYGPLGSSVHGISQARIMEWVAIPFSRASSQPGMECGSPALQADSLLYEPAVNYWTVNKFACTLDGDTIYVFQRCLLYKHLWKDSLKQDSWCLCS